jgi:hypothetical protein
MRLRISDFELRVDISVGRQAEYRALRRQYARRTTDSLRAFDIRQSAIRNTDLRLFGILLQELPLGCNSLAAKIKE